MYLEGMQIYYSHNFFTYTFRVHCWFFFLILETESDRAHACVSGVGEMGRGRERILSRFHAQWGAQYRAQSQHPEIMTRAEIRVEQSTDWTTHMPPIVDFLNPFYLYWHCVLSSLGHMGVQGEYVQESRQRAHNHGWRTVDVQLMIMGRKGDLLDVMF